MKPMRIDRPTNGSTSMTRNGKWVTKHEWYDSCDTCGKLVDVCGPRPGGYKFTIDVGDQKSTRCIECQDLSGVEKVVDKNYLPELFDQYGFYL
jgi:hypothetical protein